ncbi:MAG: alpha/beta hydrolase [Chloroflexi bacterium]|nr:alpha/beta hydrolase [Chloroflexota bacterium]MCY3589016.1 alpha/beta hydrolase [Chloroflexota bacterium]MCY3684776.1 alpha/beta hydrolase [Chloroflexota bacterium]MDE2709787.1 alpha/beta hydrolase [Chloroflexota bacterium]
MASPELQQVLKLIEDRPRPLVNPTRQQIRQAMEERSFPATDAASIAWVEANGVPGEWVTVAESDPSRRVLYFHGGGYVYGSAVTHRRLCEDIAAAGRCAVLNLDYRLAPEHPFPAAVEDAIEALKFVQANGPDGPGSPDSTFVAGDSAGGGLTLATLLAARERDLDQPDAAIAISAWTDLANTGDSIASLADDDPQKSSVPMLENLACQYLAGADAENPLASPLYADFTGLPPLLMQVGGAEMLLSDTTRAAERARAAGVDVVEEVWDDMFHVWHLYAPMLPEGQQAIERIGEFINQHA